MTVIFPEKLPYPTTDGYAIKPGEAIVRTDMEEARQDKGGVMNKRRLKFLCAG